MELLDEKDKDIIEILQQHGEYTTRQIAKKTLLPVTTIHNRIKKLRKQGYIKKYTVELDWHKLQRDFLVYVLISANLQILKQKKKTQYDLMNEIRKFILLKELML